MAAKQKVKNQSVAGFNHLLISKLSQPCIPSWCLNSPIHRLTSGEAPQAKTSAKSTPVAILIGRFILTTVHAIVSGIGLILAVKHWI
jgi:hypothetical protein